MKRILSRTPKKMCLAYRLSFNLAADAKYGISNLSKTMEKGLNFQSFPWYALII